MICSTQVTGANAGGPRLLPMRTRWAARAAQFWRSPTMRAQRAQLKSRRDDVIIAQGKRGTSAALGCGLKNFLFFPFGLAHRRRAKPKGKKKRRGSVALGNLPKKPRRPAACFIQVRPST